MNFLPGISWEWKLLGAGVIIAVLYLAIHMYTRKVEQVGELRQSNKDLTHTFKEVENAHKAQDKIRRSPSELHNQCVQDSRTPQNCE